MADAGNGLTRCDYCGNIISCDKGCPSDTLASNAEKLAWFEKRFWADQKKIEDLNVRILDLECDDTRFLLRRFRELLHPVGQDKDWLETVAQVLEATGKPGYAVDIRTLAKFALQAK